MMNEKLRLSFLQALPLWIASVLGGLTAVCYTVLFGWGESLFKYILHFGALPIAVISPIVFLLAWWLVQRYAPFARGSGIPQVIAAIDLSDSPDEKKVSRLLSLRVIIVKIFSSLLMVIGGAPVGREGPTVQISASVFRLVRNMIPASWPKLSEKGFVLTGAAAGLAAAFNTPLGGIVFAIEELAREHMSVFRTALFSAVIIAGLVAQGILGPYLYLGYPDVKGMDAWMFVYVILCAVICGPAGAFFGRLIRFSLKWKKSIGILNGIVMVLIVGVSLALVGYFVDPRLFGSGKEVLLEVLFGTDKHVEWYTVLFRFAGPILVFAIGASGGVFAPSLAAGAAIGAILAEAFNMFGANANILILTGMVGFLTGVARTPFTSAIIVLEMTDRHSVIFHLMIAALVSNLAALVVERHSLYEFLTKQYHEEMGTRRTL